MRKLTLTLTCCSLLIGVSLTIWGLVHLQWPQALPWSDKAAFIRYAGLLFVSATLVFALSRWSKKSPLALGSAVAMGYVLLAGALWPLLIILWFAIASTLLGIFALNVLRISAQRENWLTSLLIGAGIYGTAVGLLAHFPVAYPGVYGVALALPIMLGWRVIAEETKRFCSQINSNKASFRVNRLDVAITAVALIYLVVALMPELGYDSLAMHLFIPAHVKLRHQWGFDAGTYVWAVMPMLGEWIYSIGYMLAGEPAARLMNVGFIFILSWLVRDLVLWAGGSMAGARWAVLLFLSTPLTFTEGSTLFIESIWASFAVAGTLATLKACSHINNPKRELPIAGFLLGCALATKAVTFTILPGLLLLLIWRYRTWLKGSGFPYLILGLCLFLVMGFIPYMTAWELTSNPVFPFFNHIFHSIYFPSGQGTFNGVVYNEGMIGGAVYHQGFRWDTFYRTTFESGKYLEAVAGASGFQWLLLMLPGSILLLVTKKSRAIALLILGVLSIAITFQFMSYLRYVFPAWAILTATIGVALDMVVSSRYLIIKNLSSILAAAVVGLNLIFFTAGALYYYGDFSFKPIFDTSSREHYLNNRLPLRNAVELVNRLNTTRAPVAVFTEPLTAGLAGDSLSPCWYNVEFQREIASIHEDQDLVKIFKKRNVHFIILDLNWNGANCCGEGAEKQALIEKISSEIARVGSVSVREIKMAYQFNQELLKNPDFSSIDGWTVASETKYNLDTHSLVVNVNSPAVQTVAVLPGGVYQNSVIARCVKEPTMGRIQMNWLDSKGQFVSTNIKTFSCPPIFAPFTMEVKAPLNAVFAVVYVTGHSNVPIEFKRNSLLQ